MTEKEGFLSKALRKPSPRVQLEASIVGIVVMLLASLTSCAYVIFFSNYTLFWKIITGVGEIGVLLMMLSSLATTYVQLYALKMSMGLFNAGENPILDMINQLNTNSKSISGEKSILGEGKEKPKRKKKGGEISQSDSESNTIKYGDKEMFDKTIEIAKENLGLNEVKDEK
jgi:hypothetical protein